MRTGWPHDRCSTAASAGRIVDPFDAVDDAVVVHDGAERLAGREQQLGQPGGEGEPPDG